TVAVAEAAAIGAAFICEKSVALVPAATATVAFTPSIETHALTNFPVPTIRISNQRAGLEGATGRGTSAHAPFTALQEK
ncbi:MAG TPA: hypothetical protein VM346_01750, partial [Sphingomicrobium sp.]|nr:hypothetical protein [Sphingomicrobium sp.]